MNTAHFKVDTKLTAILGETYKSIEDALTELVDNAWDADATLVKITMPEPFQDPQIMIEDNGTGMTEKELKNEYLFIARSRFSRKGELSATRNRKIKGRKGIGKFAGLLIAEKMTLIAKSNGIKTTLTIIKDDIMRWKGDLEKLDLPIESIECNKTDTGTTIILEELNQNLHFPNPIRLNRLLTGDYGRANNFQILINEKPLQIADLGGVYSNGQLKTAAGDTDYEYTILDHKKNMSQSGIAIRVGGQIVGKTQYFGLDDDMDVPKNLLKKIYGEISADGLKDDLTVDGLFLQPHSEKLIDIQTKFAPLLKSSLLEVYKQNIQQAKDKIYDLIDSELASLEPAYQKNAKETLIKISTILDGLPLQQLKKVIGLTTELLQTKPSTTTASVSTSKPLNTSNNEIVESLERYLGKNNLSAVLQTIESNPWILPDQFPSMYAKPDLFRILKNYLEEKKQAMQQNNSVRHTLFQDYRGNLLLVRMHDPQYALQMNDIYDVLDYQKALVTLFPKSKIELSILVGENSLKSLSDQNSPLNVMLYDSYVEELKNRLAWEKKNQISFSK